MPTIRDTQLNTAYRALEAQQRDRPDFKIDNNNLKKLLAAVADRWSSNADEMEAQLSRPGITRGEQLALVEKGMSASEKKDLCAILDEGTVAMTDEVRNFLTEVVGRQPVVADDAALTIIGDQTGGLIKGTVAPGATIEAINLTTAPEKRLHTDDTFVLGKSDANGQFTGRLPDMQEGDIIRLRKRDAQGKVGSWIDIRATGMGVDTRDAQVKLARIGLEDLGNDKVKLFNINSSRQISEPGAEVRLVNERTGEHRTFTMNKEGTFGGAMELPGKAGDTFTVHASDGTNNTDFARSVGTVKVPGGDDVDTGIDLPDPKLHKDECRDDGTPRYSKVRYTGPLFKNGAKATDVEQGSIGDCYLPSAIASIAYAKPGLFEDLIKQNDDGTFTVTFKERDWRTRSYKDVKITVDGDLWSRSWGGPIYGSSSGSTKAETMELWWPILEKAYAQWKGSFNTIGNGGSSSRVFTEVLGRDSDNMSVRPGSEDRVWNKIKDARGKGFPVSAGTYGKDDSNRYTNTGVYPNHSYSIYGVEEKDGERYVEIRNPWGESEPYPGDGKNDGIFMLKLEDFTKLYQTLYTVD